MGCSFGVVEDDVMNALFGAQAKRFFAWPGAFAISG
jgi:hypothetical protein